jgi:hypothetical protein
LEKRKKKMPYIVGGYQLSKIGLESTAEEKKLYSWGRSTGTDLQDIILCQFLGTLPEADWYSSSFFHVFVTDQPKPTDLIVVGQSFTLYDLKGEEGKQLCGSTVTNGDVTHGHSVPVALLRAHSECYQWDSSVQIRFFTRLVSDLKKGDSVVTGGYTENFSTIDNVSRGRAYPWGSLQYLTSSSATSGDQTWPVLINTWNTQDEWQGSGVIHVFNGFWSFDPAVCCFQSFPSSSLEASLCKQVELKGGTTLCDRFMETYCKKSPNDKSDICQCIVSEAQGNKYPACTNAVCSQKGYKTQKQLQASCASKSACSFLPPGSKIWQNGNYVTTCPGTAAAAPVPPPPPPPSPSPPPPVAKKSDLLISKQATSSAGVWWIVAIVLISIVVIIVVVSIVIYYRRRRLATAAAIAATSPGYDYGIPSSERARIAVDVLSPG